MDDEANLPMPRRDPRNVPEVQLILIEDVDRTFVAYIEKTFRDRGLTCGVFQLPRVSLVAVIKRQILEGVQAVVKILRQSQITGKIPLQVFDYSAGVDNVRYEGNERIQLSEFAEILIIFLPEYNEVDAHIAAELVVRAKASRLGPPAVSPSYGIPPYGRPPQPPLQSPIPPQQAPQPPNIANLITSLDGPALQKLLGAMAQTQPSPQTPQQPPSQFPDFSSVLGGNHQHQQVQQGYPQYPQQSRQQQPDPYTPNPNAPPFGNNPALTSLLANVGANRPHLQQQGMPPMPQDQPGQQQHVQNIMEQLARWKQ
ncbi:MAG: hypothetical protein Q9223_000327 [Gallowayella weberi]